jgi:hypothetical protein
LTESNTRRPSGRVIAWLTATAWPVRMILGNGRSSSDNGPPSQSVMPHSRAQYVSCTAALDSSPKSSFAAVLAKSIRPSLPTRIIAMGLAAMMVCTRSRSRWSASSARFRSVISCTVPIDRNGLPAAS